MTKRIEVAEFADSDSITRYSRATWNNQEPGFQVDGVTTVDELYELFDIIQKAAPTKEARDIEFDDATPEDADFDYISSVLNGISGKAHVDGIGDGLALQHNITDTFPVALGLAKQRFATRPKMKWPYVDHLRTGLTIPGRLTVFSEGGLDWLRPTAHQFFRPTQEGNEWARYSQSRTRKVGEANVRRVAQTALNRIELKSKDMV